ncbi:uncharacterized protein [Rhodnius prolixus]|uniref:uncharacterized protein n=1 Tax=Rhodnius prolixus TaxID=13249 RepID=UPI003D18BE34
MAVSYTKIITNISGIKHFTSLKQQNITTITTTDMPPIVAAVNVLQLGVTVGCILILLAVVCYVWHWNFTHIYGNNSSTNTRRQDSWNHLSQLDTPVHIFSLDNQDVTCDTEELERPPPSYDEAIKNADADLPSYETAVNVSARGYV